MVTDTEKELERIFMSYNKALEKLKLLNVKTKSNKDITHKDLRAAINIMEKKHPTCRWKGQRNNKNKNYIVTEGFYWLLFVYFQTEKSFIDADIDFFEKKIKSYEEFLHIAPKKFWQDDMYVFELEEYFGKANGTIKNNIIKMNKTTNGIYKFCENGKYKISKEGIEWLCKNCFKQKYLELLEGYKMQLTKKYIDAGYPYDIF